MIKIKDIVKKYDNNYVFKKFSYEFKTGLYLVMGESGKGKTTLLNILSGIDKKFTGKLFVNENILYFKDKDTLPGELSVKEVFYLFELANELKMNIYFEIHALLNKKIKKLSLGEKQLIILNMVLNSKEKIIIMDEPFSALSINNHQKACALIEKKAKDKLIIIATHNKEYFNEYILLNLDDLHKEKIKDFNSFYFKETRKFKLSYYFLYLKKTYLRKLVFIISLIVTLFNFTYINNYSNNLINDYLLELGIEKGILIERKNAINEIDENVFYEVVKQLSPYIINYNANYYNSDLYNYDIKVNDYYIDNGFILSSFGYVESALEENEIVLGLDYNKFCINNEIYNCDENYLKTLLINKEMDSFSFVIKEIFNNEETAVLNNERFNKLYDNNEYVEYYFDLKIESVNKVFKLINNNEFLMEFDYLKVGENDDEVRYKISIDNKKKFSFNINYSNYIVCLDKGYNCFNYLNHFSSLVSIDEYKDISVLKLEVISSSLGLDEIVISSRLSNVLNKSKGETISLYFNYKDMISNVDLVISDVIESENIALYHNSNWSYYFFKEMLHFDEEDLQIENLIVYEDVLEENYISDDLYKNALEDVKGLLKNTNKVIFYINFSLNVVSILVLVLVELFYNKFKKEYFSYLKILNVNKKMFPKKHL